MFESKVIFFIRDPCLLKSIIFVFVVFISSFHLSQYVSRLLCRPSFEVDIITKSSAYFKQLIDVVSPNEIGSFPSDVIARGISLIYKLKKIILIVINI